MIALDFEKITHYLANPSIIDYLVGLTLVADAALYFTTENGLF